LRCALAREEHQRGHPRSDLCGILNAFPILECMYPNQQSTFSLNFTLGNALDIFEKRLPLCLTCVEPLRLKRARPSAHACMHASCMHITCMHHACNSHCVPACMRACTQRAYIHTNIHTHIHTYMHEPQQSYPAAKKTRNRRRYGVRSESTRDGQFTIRVDPERLSYVRICIYASIIYSYLFIYAPAHASRLEI